jgi:hypothetical protein
MLAQHPGGKVRARIEGHADALAVALPQLEVQAPEGVGLRRADVADRVTRAHVLRARPVEVGADRDDGLEVGVVRRPAVAVVDDDSEAVAEPPGERDLPPSIASAGVIAGIRCETVPYGVPMGQLATVGRVGARIRQVDAT